jgi:hypothetical protein
MHNSCYQSKGGASCSEKNFYYFVVSISTNIKMDVQEVGGGRGGLDGVGSG